MIYRQERKQRCLAKISKRRSSGSIVPVEVFGIPFAFKHPQASREFYVAERPLPSLNP